MAFDELETCLSHQRWLVGGRLTEVDLRLFPTLVRLDTVYYVLFKCNLRRLAEYHKHQDHPTRCAKIVYRSSTGNCEDFLFVPKYFDWLCIF